VGSSDYRSKVRSELANWLAIAREGDLRDQNQQQRAQALSPSCAVALAPIRAFWFKFLRHKMSPFPIARTNVEQSYA
jgi:hypothetical protein